MMFSLTASECSQTTQADSLRSTVVDIAPPKPIVSRQESYIRSCYRQHPSSEFLRWFNYKVERKERLPVREVCTRVDAFAKESINSLRSLQSPCGTISHSEGKAFVDRCKSEIALSESVHRVVKRVYDHMMSSQTNERIEGCEAEIVEVYKDSRDLKRIIEEIKESVYKWDNYLSSKGFRV